jgi:hypothetical protein
VRVPPGITRTRGKLISVLATRDTALREALSDYAPTAAVLVKDPMVPLIEAAVAWPDQGRDRVHPLHLAFATMSVLRNGTRPLDQGPLVPAPVVGVLADPAQPGGVPRVEEALRKAASPTLGKRDRWKTLVAEAGDQLDPELRKIDDTWCENGVSRLDNEMVARVETRLVVSEPKEMDELAFAVMPDNWSKYNDFFCSVTPRPDRDAEAKPPANDGKLTSDLERWRGVYEERVGSCPTGWFPDTFLLFTWRRTANQIILRYELGPRRPGDRTVLRVDQGYVQVDRVGPRYVVSTVKYLLFDDARIPSGGQTLGLTACQLGWLDYSINQFGGSTVAAIEDEANQDEPDADQDELSAGIDAPLQVVLKQCEAEIRHSASETDAQLARILRQIRDGRYSLDAGIADLGELVTRAIRDGARSLRGQTALAQRYAEVVRDFTQRPGDQR